MYYEYLLGIMGNQNFKEAFSDWLSNNTTQTSGTKNSYITAIELLSEKTGYTILEENNIEKLTSLYDDLIVNQSVEGGKYWNKNLPSFGIEGFYSVSISIYIEFLREYLPIKARLILKNTSAPLNQILYGPPGTGKTYQLQKEYFDKFTINETALSRDQYLESLIIGLNWWQIISIVVLDLGSANVNEIHKHEFIRIKEKLSTSKTIRPTIWGQLQSHTVLECPNVKVANRIEPLFFYKSEDIKWTVDHELLDQYYPEAFEILNKSKNFEPNSSKSIKNYEFITFHQSFSYEDFIEGIKPRLDDGEKDVSFEIKDGVFKRLCTKAATDPDNDYAIFIDEINRGNVSAIFGELITLIEEDKRIGGTNEIKVRLPYSKSEFGVPSNLFIIGTMNTADRSIEALDTALRRRFSFTEVMPDSTLLDKIEFNGFTLGAVLKTLNERIEVLLDRDHTIGHSYFLKLKNRDVEGLKSVFANNIIPLLQEYFYHDYEKIALILGEGFVKMKENKTVKFANFRNIDSPEILNQFELISSIEDIEKAINLLLNKE
jgi:Cdc6-like AAA superfamily ATPase